MDYRRHRDALVLKATQACRVKCSDPDSDYVYCENHHIVPRSLGGSDDAANLVLLTYKERLVAHLLLAKFSTGSDKYK